MTPSSDKTATIVASTQTSLAAAMFIAYRSFFFLIFFTGSPLTLIPPVSLFVREANCLWKLEQENSLLEVGKMDELGFRVKI